VKKLGKQSKNLQNIICESRMPYAVEIWGLNEDRKSPMNFRREFVRKCY